jgi:hypothetical protein
MVKGSGDCLWSSKPPYHAAERCKDKLCATALGAGPRIAELNGNEMVFTHDCLRGFQLRFSFNRAASLGLSGAYWAAESAKAELGLGFLLKLYARIRLAASVDRNAIKHACEPARCELLHT